MLTVQDLLLSASNPSAVHKVLPSFPILGGWYSTMTMRIPGPASQCMLMRVIDTEPSLEMIFATAHPFVFSYSAHSLKRGISIHLLLIGESIQSQLPHSSVDPRTPIDEHRCRG